MITVISLTKRYPAANRCIYCGTTAGPLGDEHIIPYSLGGRLVLPNASCRACEKITCRIETICTQHLMGDFRRRIRMPSRNKRPATTTIDIVQDDDSIERKTIPADEFPRVLVLPQFSVPEILSGQPAGAPDAWIIYNRKDVERAKEHGGKGFTAARYNLTMFTRMLAKIAHAYTVAECGPEQTDTLQSLLPDFILTGLGNPYAFVGSDPISLSAENFMYRIGCFHHPVGEKNYLCVFVRLYAFIKTAPLYQIAVANITE